MADRGARCESKPTEALLGRPGPSLGTIHNILHEAAATAQVRNDGEDLSGIHVAALDEIYQSDRPTLVGVDLSEGMLREARRR